MVHYYGYNGIKYDVERLWHITRDNPIVTMDVDQFKKMVYSKPWYDSQGNRIGPIDVVSSDSGYHDHKKRINVADMTYPILVEIDNQIVDGFHRIAKAYQESLKQVPVKYVSPEQLHYALYDNSYEKSPKLVYSAAQNPANGTLEPIMSRKHGKVVFGSPFRWMAIIMGATNSIGKHWICSDIEVGIVTENDDFYPIITELRLGAFDEFLEQPMYIHTIRSKDKSFVLHDRSPSYCYYTNPNPCEVLRTEHIPNPKTWLEKALGYRMVRYGLQ